MSTLKVNELDTKSGTVITVAAGKTLDVTLADDAIGAAQLATDSVTADAIAADAVDSAEIKANAVTNAKMADDAIGIAELSATGTAATGTYLQGDNTWGAIATAGFNSIQFLTTGNWTRPTGVTKVVVTLVGGGGGGGAGNPPTYWGGSAGAGGVMKCVLDVSSIASSTLSIGAAGTTSGGTGGSTTWTDGTNTLTATGGAGGGGAGGSWHGAGGAGGIPVVTLGSPLAQLLLTGGHGTKGSAGGSSPGLPLLGFGYAAYNYGDTTNQTVTGYGVAGYGQQTGSTAGQPGIIIVEEYK